MYELTFYYYTISLHKNWLRDRGNITGLSFIDSDIKVIDLGPFNAPFFGNLEWLTFYKTSVDVQLYPIFFTGLDNLQELYIYHDEISPHQLTRDSFANLINLRSLTLRLESDTKFDLDLILGDYQSVTSLDLSYNLIEVIPRGVLDRLPNLERLLLIISHISSIEAGAFDGLQKLSFISLRYNLFQTLPPGLFDDVAQRSSAQIVLDFNNLICDCNLKGLQELVTNETTRVGIFEPQKIKCFCESENEFFFLDVKDVCSC